MRLWAEEAAAASPSMGVRVRCDLPPCVTHGCWVWEDTQVSLAEARLQRGGLLSPWSRKGGLWSSW